MPSKITSREGVIQPKYIYMRFIEKKISLSVDCGMSFTVPRTNARTCICIIENRKFIDRVVDSLVNNVLVIQL